MSPRHLVAAAAFILLSSPLSAQSVKAGIEAWQRADYSAAVAIWRPLAERGDADAQFNLGQAYRLGRGVPINLSQARTWFERAAGTGHLDAETTLGLLLFQNGDQAQGLKWLRQAAEQGEPRAMLVYGTALYHGDGVTQDRALGYAYVSRAAGIGLAPAKETLAQLDELVAPADRQKAMALIRATRDKEPAPSRNSTKPKRVAEAEPATLKPTSPKPAPKASPPTVSKPAPVPSGAWRIQLGAFSQRSAAEALYHRLSGKPALAGRSPSYVAAGSVTRLQIGPYASKAAAAAACGSLGTACFPIPAK
ncbi:MAG: SPOR domain-containing protein [Sphingomicrobium sp.]